MATQQNPAFPHHDARSGGALDPETRQQVGELNLRGIEVLRAVLGAAGGGATAGSAADAAALRRAGAARRGEFRARRAATGGAQDRIAARDRATRVALARSGLAASMSAPLRSEGPPLPDALRLLGAEWLALDDAARHRLAACPYLLFELDFAGLMNAVTPPPRVVQESRVVPGAPCTVASPFAGAEGRGFARLLLHYSWHLVRSAPAAAGFVLGAPQPALESLRVQGLSRVESLAATAGGWVRLRWDHEPLIWIDWLEAARTADPAALWSSQLRGLQRIAGVCRDAQPSA